MSSSRRWETSRAETPGPRVTAELSFLLSSPPPPLFLGISLTVGSLVQKTFNTKRETCCSLARSYRRCIWALSHRYYLFIGPGFIGRVGKCWRKNVLYCIILIWNIFMCFHGRLSVDVSTLPPRQLLFPFLLPHVKTIGNLTGGLKRLDLKTT